ncbi:MAG: hypothetical protein DHS20C12_10590 [Pseudohongiella sp.]|nr:MAG: hypothetical protein DHS20C12_10590 [Pseudohongiella sp.]
MKAIIFLLGIFHSVGALADGFQTEEELRSFTDELVANFAASEFEDALNSAKPYWPIPAIEIDSMLNQITQQWPMIENRFGSTTGYEFIKEERIGNSFIRYYYLHKFDNHAIYWQIDSYQSTTEWQINSVTFLDTLELLFE